jgi:hypothetical protein
MSAETLFFNGVNGASGTYGLEPMTSQELVNRVLRTAAPVSDERKRLESQLERDQGHKFAALVRFLTESNFEVKARDDAWLDAWLERLAGVLVREFLGDEYSDPVQLEALKDRLRGHTVDKMERLALYLATGQTQELAELLLRDPDQKPDNSPVLKERLKRDATDQIDRIQGSLLAASRAEDLSRVPGEQDAWLSSLLDELALMPVQALNAIGPKKVRPLKELVKQLDAFADGVASPWLDGWRQMLEPEVMTLSWSTSVQILQQGLATRIEAQDESVAWSELLAALRNWLEALRSTIKQLAPVPWVDPTDLAEAGWGIVFPHEDPRYPAGVPAIKEALGPLLALRRSQAGQYFKIYEGADGYRPNDTAAKFVARHGARVSDPADPKKVPYYLLIVGSPEEIPFHFQYQLDVQYAVGRIDFGQDLAAYANYARSVVSAERREATVGRRVTFFGVSNPDDPATQMSAEHLVGPLSQRTGERAGAGWQVEAVLREEATKARLLGLLGGQERPALLFAACHGVEFPKDDPQGRQERYQGALLCQDWAGPQVGRGEVPRETYLAGEDLTSDLASDLTSDLDLRGLVAFFLACYSAGTPRFDEYTEQAFRERRETIAERPFVAALPKAMLGLPQGALAVVGHVERAWGTSFLGERQSTQIAVFESAVERLLKGVPVGAAMEYFNGRHAALSSELAAEMESAKWKAPNPYDLAEMWTANNDARGYIVLGDPAVRLPLE